MLSNRNLFHHGSIIRCHLSFQECRLNLSYINFWGSNFRSFRIPKTCCESKFRLPCQVTGCLIAAVMCLYLITDFQWDLGPKARFSFFWLEVGAIESDIIENKRGENEKKQQYKQLYNFKSKRNTNKQQESRSSIHNYCITSLFPQQKWWCIYYIYIHLFLVVFLNHLYTSAFNQPTLPNRHLFKLVVLTSWRAPG